MTDEEDKLEEELQEILSKMGASAKSPLGLDITDEESILKILVPGMKPEDVAETAIKALNRARLALLVAVAVCELCCSLHELSDYWKEEFKKAVLEQGRQDMTRMYGIDIEKP